MEYINKSELATISTRELNGEAIRFLFAGQSMEKSCGTIFVLDEKDCFFGVISSGDYRRYKKHGTGLVNEHCKTLFFNDHEWENAATCRVQFPNIKILPVIEKDTKRLVGAIRLFESRNTFYSDTTDIFDTQRKYLEEYCIENSYDEIAVFGDEISLLRHALTLLRNLNFFKQICPIIQNEFVSKEIANEFRYPCMDKYQRKTGLRLCLDENRYIENSFTPRTLSRIVFEYFDKKGKEKNNGDGIGFFRISNKASLEEKYGISIKFVGIPSLNDLIIDKKTLLTVSEADVIHKPLSDFAKKFFHDDILADDIMKLVLLRWSDLSVTNCEGEHLKIRNGKRFLPNANYHAKRRVYLIGPCIVEGRFANDTNSVGYLLQEKLRGQGWEVCVRSASVEWGNYIKWLGHIKVREGDMIIFIDRWYRLQKNDLYVKESFQKAYDQYGQYFTDSPIHCNYIGHRFLAEEIFKAFFENKPIPIENDAVHSPRGYIAEFHKESNKVFENNTELEKYKEYLLEMKGTHNGRIGAIVMNCNPFTLGHRYLIEYAYEKVDFLYIFVVQEDRSVFPFEDRIRLVREGTKDLEKLSVLPSGKFIISSDTFSEYFTKGMTQNGSIDTSLDVETFAQHIAPVLNISVRFVGEEPLDAVTLQYNQDMLEILPDYGIEVNVVPRKKFQNEVISASRVRKLLDEANWKKIRKLVPNVTYRYLRNWK